MYKIHVHTYILTIYIHAEGIKGEYSSLESNLYIHTHIHCSHLACVSEVRADFDLILLVGLLVDKYNF